MTGVQTCALPICFPVTIAWAVSQGTGNMSEPAKKLEGLIKEGKVRYNSGFFEYACECAMMGMTKKNNMEVYRENDKTEKIDPLIAFIIALSSAILFYFIVFGIKPNFFSVTIKLAWKR